MKRPGVGPDPAPVRHSQNRGTTTSKDHSQEDPAAGDPTGENDPGLLTSELQGHKWTDRRGRGVGGGGQHIKLKESKTRQQCAELRLQDTNVK